MGTIAGSSPAEVISEREWNEIRTDLALPPRQADIVKHIMHGRSDKQIARQLGITVPTVRTHVTRLFRRVGINDRVELILHVIAHLRRHDRSTT